MLRRLLQPLWVLLAIIFLIEAWLWDHLEPIVAKLVAWIPLREFKQWLSDRVDSLSPAMTLIVFAVPVLLLLPLKMVGLWLLAHEYWLSAILVYGFAKFAGLGITAFIFDVTRHKLLQMGWFKWLYDYVLWLRAEAGELVAPIKQRIKTIMERKQCSEREAKTFIESTDREREQFVRRYFLHEVTDPHQYDLVVNLAHIPREEAVDVIVGGAKRHAERALASSRAEIQKTTAGAAAH